MAYLFRGDFETGDTSQWDGLSDETTVGTISGLFSLRTTYTCGTGLLVTPNVGSTTVAMAKSLLKPQTGSQTESRAEQVKNYDFASYYQKSIYFTWAFLLDPDYTWTGDWTADATNNHWAPVVFQALGRNLFASDIMVNLHPSGWQTETGGMCVSLFGKGGQSSVNSPSTGTAEHRLACDPNTGNGWTTLLAPATAESSGAQRFPQILGPHCQLGQNIPVTVGEWWEIILQVDCYTDVASGGYTCWVRKRGSGVTWTKTLDTARTYKTVQWYPVSQPKDSSGPNNVHRVGGYVYGLPANRQFFWDQFTVSDSFTDATSVFFDETGGSGGGSSGSSPTYVQQAHTVPVAASASTLAQAWTTNVTVGNVIVGAAFWENASDESATSVTDNLGNTYTLGTHLKDSGSTYVGQLFTGVVTTGGACTTTVTFPGGRTNRAVAMHEVTNADTASPLDQSLLVRQAGATGTDAMTTGNLTTGFANDYLFSCLFRATTSSTTTQGTGFTRKINDGALDSEDLTKTNPGTAAGTWTLSSAVGSWLIAAQAIKPAGTSSTGYKNTVLATAGLQSLWMLDETAGASTVADSKGAITGTTFHDTLGSATMLPTGETSCSFNGDLGGTNGSNISFGDNYDFTGAVAFTVELVLNATTIDATARRIIDKGSTGTSGWEIQVDSGAGGITFERFGSGFDNTATKALTASTPSHVVCTYDGSNMQVWVNNSSGTAAASTGSLAGNSANLILGNRSDEIRTFAGTMQAVAIYNVALSSGTIASHYGQFVAANRWRNISTLGAG